MKIYFVTDEPLKSVLIGASVGLDLEKLRLASRIQYIVFITTVVIVHAPPSNSNFV